MVNIYSKYEQLAVKLCCINSKGSGCLFQPFTNEYSYVITAKHCLEGTDDVPQTFDISDIKVFLNTSGTINQLTVLDYYPHSEFDLAVIKVEYVEAIPSTLITIPRGSQSIGLYGFPYILQDQDANEVGHYLKCSINFIRQSKKLIEFTPISSATNIITNLDETMLGFSGSGMYHEKNDNLYLVGVFTELKEENGAYNTLLGYDISAVNQILYDYQLPGLIPEELLDFERYIDSAFESNEGFIKPVLKRNARSLRDLYPNHIVNSYNEKLYLPYNPFIEEELLNPKLWEGWVSLLTYYYMDTACLPREEDFKLVRSRGNYRHNIRMFFTKHEKLSNCIMDLFTDNYDDLEKNDVIVINTKSSSPGTKSCNKEKTQRLLRKIDNGRREKLIERGIKIDNPEHLKNIELIHIDLFKEKFSVFDEIEDDSELEERLRESIREVLNNVP